MKYNKVEVLKPIPDCEPGIYNLSNTESPDPWFSYLMTKGGIKYCFCDIQKATNFFRLISEPEFVKDGYAKCIAQFEVTPFFKPGLILKIADFDRQKEWLRFEGWANEKFDSTCFTPSTKEEFEAQEEAKKPWRPKMGEDYVFIDADYDCATTNYIQEHRGDSRRMEFGNCFRSQEAAHFFRDNYLKPAYAKYSEDYASLPDSVK